MTYKKFLWCGALGFVLYWSGTPDAIAQSYAVEGPGRMSCSEFTELGSGSSEFRDAASWLTGYMTAHHKLSPQVFDLSPWQTPSIMLGLVRQYCTAQPEDNVERAAVELVRYLAPDALTAPSDMVAMRKGDQVTLHYEIVLERTYLALENAGFFKGQSDPDLSKAIEEFQKSQGIPATGLPDQRTLADLLGKR